MMKMIKMMEPNILVRMVIYRKYFAITTIIIRIRNTGSWAW